MTPVETDRAEGAAPSSIASLLARAERLTDVLPALHQRAIDLSGGRCSLLFEISPHGSRLQATSGFALETLEGGPWTPGAAERDVAEQALSGRPVFVDEATTRTPDLAARLGTPAVCLVPLALAGRRRGLLAIGFESDTQADLHALTGIADDFVLALELFRLRRQDDLHQDVRALLDEFSATVSATLDVGAGLEIICHRARRLFGADRTSVWIHDRGARHLALRASSDREYLSTAARINTDDLLSPAAAAMRRSRSAAIPGESSTHTVAVPLRGCRRALGALVFDGVRIEPGGELHLLDRADEVGRQLSSALDSLQMIEEIGRSRAELESIFDALPSLIAVTDHRGRIVHSNHSFASRLHQQPARLRSRLLTDCVGPQLAGWVDESTSAGGSTAAAAREVTDPVIGGPLLVTLMPRLDRAGHPGGLIFVARELGDRARLEPEREAVPDAQAQKLAALGRFVAGLAHELNNPLQGVLGHLDLLRATHALPKQIRPAMRTIYCEADRAAKIVRSLLMFAGSRRTIRRRVNLHGVMQKVIVLRQRTCRTHDIEVVRHYRERLPRVLGDPLLLHQVFLNMFTNAEQAIASTGRPGRIEISTDSTKDAVTLIMRDTGPGISPQVLLRIFEPFYTTKDVGEGTGLGLAIAYGIVHDHGGRITAANHPDGGAVLTVELPAAPGRTAARA